MRGGAESGLGDGAQHAGWLHQVDNQVAQRAAAEAEQASQEFEAKVNAGVQSAWRSASRRPGS